MDMEDLQFTISAATGGFLYAIYCTGQSAGASINIRRCHIRCTQGSVGNYVIGINNNDADCTINVRDSYLIGFVDQSGSHSTGIFSWSGPINVYNCVVHACERGIGMTGGATITAYNTIVSASTYTHWELISGSWGSSDYNFAPDSSAPGANSIDGGVSGYTPGYLDTTPGSENLHISGTSDLIGLGVGPSANGNIAAIDFDGDSRSGATCDMGADEVDIIAITVSDGFVFSDTPTLWPWIEMLVADGMAFGDTVTQLPTIAMVVTDGLLLGDSPTLRVITSTTMNAVFTSRKPGAAFTSKKPGTTFTSG
jgi:hypothetical protein